MISIVIPTYNEAQTLPRLLAELAGERAPHEIIVADGGSRDGTAGLARAAGAVVIHCARGRGPQLRAGAAVSRGDTLLFLHADTRFPAGGLERLAAVLAAAPRLVGGNFRVVFDGGTSFSRRLTRVYNGLRRWGLYWGDSGIFARRAAYDAIGGVRPLALMEDYDFVARLEAHGPTQRIEETPLIASSRKFRDRPKPGVVWGWLKLHALYHLGVPAERLARLYYGDQD